MESRFRNAALRLLGSLLLLAPVLTVPTAAQVPRPSDVFGFEPGDDYKLADYGQMLEYYRKLDHSSERVKLREIGKSVLGRPLLLLLISSEENMKRLDQWRRISSQLARARVNQQQAQELAREGKAVVWIDGGLHATEKAHGQMTAQLAYRVATEETPEMQKIRDNVVLLLMPVMNPDGLDIVVDWYRKNLGSPFETTNPPQLYHHYVGHDNNRDWFMNNMPETQAVSKVLYNEWFPQIVYNHHQTSPAWARIFLPPFSDPVNPRIHPGVTTGVNLVGSAMAHRFAVKGMPGAVSDTVFSMWWDGGMRTVPYFHNMIGILTETAHATPTPRSYDPKAMPERIGGRRSQGPPTDGTDIFYPFPWKGGESHFKDAVNYMLEASFAVLEIAADRKDGLLFNIYRMGRDAIESSEGGPFAYLIDPQRQWDKGEALNLLNILLRGGIEMERAVKPFQAGGKEVPADTYLIFSSQAFRPYLLDLLEKQSYPDRLRYPGGPPDPPYDLAGWTIPIQMGVDVERIENPFQAKSESVGGLLERWPGKTSETAGYGFILSANSNLSVAAVNDLLAGGFAVYRAQASLETDSASFGPGSFVIEGSGPELSGALQDSASRLGVDFVAIPQRPSVPLVRLEKPRVGLYQSWVPNMDEGWTRWLLEQYHFAPKTLHNQELREGDLSDFDAIVLADQQPQSILNGHAPETMPAQYVGGIGLEGALALKRFVEQGGTLITLDRASDFAIEQFGLPLRNVVGNLSQEDFFIPGSLVRIGVNAESPLAFGIPDQVSAFFVRSRAFETIRLSRKGEGGREDIPEAPPPGVTEIARYPEKNLLLSGWAMGEEQHIGGKSALIQAQLGKGTVVLFGFRPQFRGQSRVTYKLLFNALLQSGARH